MSQSEAPIHDFSEEECDSGKSNPVPKRQKKKATLSNIVYLILSRISFNKIFVLQDVINILCNPMHIKVKSKYLDNLLQIMDYIKEKLTARNSGDVLDEKSILDLRRCLNITDSCTTSTTSTLSQELAEVRQTSLSGY